MKRTEWKTVALLAALARSASLASGKPKKSGKKSAKDSGEAAAALKTATEDFVRVEAGTFMMGICEERREDRDGAVRLGRKATQNIEKTALFARKNLEITALLA